MHRVFFRLCSIVCCFLIVRTRKIIVNLGFDVKSIVLKWLNTMSLSQTKRRCFLFFASFLYICLRDFLRFLLLDNMLWPPYETKPTKPRLHLNINFLWCFKTWTVIPLPYVKFEISALLAYVSHILRMLENYRC